MFAVIITLCASAAMNDCQVFSFGSLATRAQCEALADVHREVLGRDENNNYRIDCEPVEGDFYAH